MALPSTPLGERKVEELDPRLLHQYRRLCQTLDAGTTEVVVTITSEWVERFPEVPAFRRLLREAQKGQDPQASKGSLLLKQLVGRTLKPETQPLQTLAKCEKILAYDPLDIRANQSLAVAARILGWSETASLGWQTLLLNTRRKAHHVHAFGLHLLDLGNNREVVELCTTHLEVFPSDPLLLALREQAAIRQSIHSAG